MEDLLIDDGDRIIVEKRVDLRGSCDLKLVKKSKDRELFDEYDSRSDTINYIIIIIRKQNSNNMRSNYSSRFFKLLPEPLRFQALL